MSGDFQQLPDNRRMESHLVDASLRVLKREPSPYSTTFPCEVVTCQKPGDHTTELFCKYSAGVDYTGFGHRGGLAYELAIYRDVLNPIGARVPKFYGGHVDPGSGEAWLALEHLSGALGVGKMHRAGAMTSAASWIGKFHRSTEGHASTTGQHQIKTYALSYYLGWVERTLQAAASFPKRLPWLEALCAQAEQLFAPLCDGPQCIIHGEYYPHNVLYHQGRVLPVDWESAVIAAGEIDLASLTENWPAATVRRCTAAYIAERWPTGVPDAFARRLLAARLYFCFRWLGDYGDWSVYPGRLDYLRHLRRIGRQMGAI